MPETLLTVPEFMERTKLSRSAAYALVKRARLGVYLGGALRIPEAALTQIREAGGVAHEDIQRRRARCRVSATNGTA